MTQISEGQRAPSGFPSLTGALAAAVLFLSGCSLGFQGHHLDQRIIASLRPGITTEQELIHMLGEPEALTSKRSEGVKVYQYRNLRVFSVGIPFFILSVGRGKQSGRTLNVIVKDGTVVDYEETVFSERFFSR